MGNCFQPGIVTFMLLMGGLSIQSFIPDGDQIISKTYMTRVEGENTAAIIISPACIARLYSRSG